MREDGNTSHLPITPFEAEKQGYKRAPERRFAGSTWEPTVLSQRQIHFVVDHEEGDLKTTLEGQDRRRQEIAQGDTSAY